MTKDEEVASEEAAMYAAYSTEPDKQQKETVAREQSDAIASLPAVQNILDWFDEVTRELTDPTKLPVSISTDAEEVKATLLLNKSLVERFDKKREEFKGRYAQYLP